MAEHGVHAAARALRENRRHSSAKKGEVIGVREDYEDKTLLSVEVQLPAVKRKRRRKGADVPDEPHHPTTHVIVPKSMEIKVGDKMTITTTVDRS